MTGRLTRLTTCIGIVAAVAVASPLPAEAHNRSHSFSGCSASSGHQTGSPYGVWINSHSCQRTRAQVTYWSDGRQQLHTSNWVDGNAAAMLSTGSYLSSRVALQKGSAQSGWLSH